MSDTPRITATAFTALNDEINVREGAGRNTAILTRIPSHTSGLSVLAMQLDRQSESDDDGQVFRWFQVVLPDGKEGWIREDLLAITLEAFGSVWGLHEVAATAAPPAPSSVGQHGNITLATPAPSVTVTVPPPSGEMFVIGMNLSGANLRAGAGSGYSALDKLAYKEQATVVDVKPDEQGLPLCWVRLVNARTWGWAREDNLRFAGNLSVGRAWNLPNDLYRSPISGPSWWIRDFDETGAVLGVVHLGWDQSAPLNTDIVTGPHGGTVVKAAFCEKCGGQGLSVADKGLSLGDSRVLSDASWNYGYGHYVIVRYDNALLPASTRAYLGTRGWGGYHAFVMYAHLNQISVNERQTLSPCAVIGRMGNSGNSSGVHLHLELRFGKTPDAAWATIRQGLTTPSQLFFR